MFATSITPREVRSGSRRHKENFRSLWSRSDGIVVASAISVSRRNLSTWFLDDVLGPVVAVVTVDVNFDSIFTASELYAFLSV